MIVYGVMELIEHGKLEELDNGESMFHMISEEVWGKAKEYVEFCRLSCILPGFVIRLLELAGKHLSKGAEHPYDLLLGKYEQFLALLEVSRKISAKHLENTHYGTPQETRQR